MFKKFISQRIFIIFVFISLTATAALAQTTAFNYQGRLTDAGMPPTANYDFEFRLFDAGGGAIGGQQILNVPVVNGVFNVSLDFGAGAFPGANRSLEIVVILGNSASVGVGTTAPKAKLDVTGGNILVASPGQGIILKLPNGATCRLFSIDNAGAMVLTTVVCP